MIKIARLAASLIALSLLCIGCGASNQPPAISDLSASADWVDPGEYTRVTCIAQDPESDELTYTWEASGGTISGEGAVINWLAPVESGVYDITATVTDGRGGRTTRELAVDVLAENNTPPLVQNLVATPPSGEIYSDESCTVTCVAADPDGDSVFGYTWEASGGTISGEGATVTWTPPDAPSAGEFTVSVRVIDSKGNRSAAKSIPITVLETPVNNGTGTNHPPVVDMVRAEWSYIERGKSGLIRCVAHDPDGDRLSYTWETPRGSVSGKGSLVNYTAPQSYVVVTVSVYVSDGRGGSTHSVVSFEVVCCSAAQKNPEWTG